MIIVMQMSLHFYTLMKYGSKSLSTIFDLVLKIAVGSIIAYIIGQHVDVFIFSTIKRYSAQIKHLSFVLMVVPC